MKTYVYLSFTLALFLFFPADSAIAESCGTAIPLPACSYTSVNGNCSVTIDRLNPVTPPTIYVRPSCTVTVIATNSFALERLTLDWKSTTIVVPPDTFQNVFAALSPGLGKLTVIGVIPLAARFACEDTPAGCADPVATSHAQEAVGGLLNAVDPVVIARSTLDDIKMAQQGPPVPATPSALPVFWGNTAVWKSNAVNALLDAASAADDAVAIAQITTKLGNLDVGIAAQKAAAVTPAQKEIVGKLIANQAVLRTRLTEVANYAPKLRSLANALDTLALAPPGIVGNASITDRTPNDRNFQTQTWVLNYENKLQPIAKRLAADAPKSEEATLVGSIADASAKQPIITITVQFQRPSRIELSTGLMVPTMPYHSFSKGSDATGTANVQQTTTYAVVPIALVNTRLVQWTARQQPSAFFITGGVGVNSATSAVEFGAGFTYSYRSLALSVLADIGRDTELGGGLHAGDPLGMYTAPPTSTVWRVKPAAAFSVRIPLGGSPGK